VEQVNLSGFPTIGKFDLRRSFSISSANVSGLADTATAEATKTANSAADSISEASAAVETVVNQAQSRIESVASELKVSLPAYYSVGLWDYCQGKTVGARPSKCTRPTTSFSFNLLDIFKSVSPEFNDLFPSKDTNGLTGSLKLSKWAISAYIVGFSTTACSLVMGLVSTFREVKSRWLKLLQVLSSTASINTEFNKLEILSSSR
jgi:hypothetical protein